MKFKKILYWILAICLITMYPLVKITEPTALDAEIMSFILTLMGITMIMARKDFNPKKDD